MTQDWAKEKLKEASDSANIGDFENYTKILEIWRKREEEKQK